MIVEYWSSTLGLGQMRIGDDVACKSLGVLCAYESLHVPMKALELPEPIIA